jgi:DNA-binding response OmpR family regulator
MHSQLFDAQHLEIGQTEFTQLMQRRIYRVLLVCSNYDFFMLEEDGRIDEQIFNEYTNLSMRFPPAIIQTDSAGKAFEIMQSDNIDLVILMLNIGDIEPFELARQLKQKYAGIPIVVLTHFSRDVTLRLQNEDLSSVDYVFCWLGNADLLLAIIKLIEDRMNAEHDVLQIGVQTIMLVEDSVRYISQILPNIYKSIIRQSYDFMQEGLNEHQKMLRLRGRPKILLAKTFDEAHCLYQKYGQHMLGIIADVSFKKNKKKEEETQEGIKLCKIVRIDDPHMPFLLQSSDASNEKYAKKLDAGFIHKLSKTLNLDLRNYILANFGFGEFIFRDPKSKIEVARASDLADLQHLILKIPEKVFAYHASRNEISKWLNARALFTIAKIFKVLRLDDFESTEQARAYIYDAISNYRTSKGRGIIASFNKKSFDEYLTFSRIGEGSLGGKGRGLAFIDAIIKKHELFDSFKGVNITIPRTVVVATDVFDEFMEVNNLFNIGLSNLADKEILAHFIKASLPNRLITDLSSFVKSVNRPVAIRSSSKLEDSYFQPFAGIYSTYMIPLVPGDNNRTVSMISDAIKCVYASQYFKASKTYIAATANIIEEEKMGIILEEVCGQAYENRFYPVISGVARSINFYPLNPETPESGIAHIAYGLGKYIVDGGISLRFSPKYPKKILQLSNPETILRETQKTFYALDLNPDKWIPSVDDKINLLKTKINEAEGDSALQIAASYYDHESNRVTDMPLEGSKKVITFSNILNHEIFPLASILQTLLEIGQKEMNNPIEIEFAVDMDRPADEPKVFYFLQIRPIVENEQDADIKIDNFNPKDALVFSKMALGNGLFKDIVDFVYIRPGENSSGDNQRITEEVERVNDLMRMEKRNYVLAGQGRWGSSDPWLGVPVKWSQITEARIIVEASIENYHIEPSQGTHFFQNLTTFRTGYMTINPKINEGIYDYAFLESQPAVYENQYIRIVRFKKPLVIKIDGKQGIGVIMKPV